MPDRARYGIDVDGNLRSIDEVARGLKCGLICTKCKRPLVARQGSRRVHHLAHHNPQTDCTGSPESQLHFLAKEVLRDSPELRIPDLKMFIDGLQPRDLAYAFVLCERTLRFDHIAIEKKLDDLRIDAIASTERGEIAIEVKVAHEVTDQKAAKLLARAVPCFEIDLSSWRRWDVSRDEVRAAVISDAPREWRVQPTAYFAAEFEDARTEVERFKAFLGGVTPRSTSTSSASALVTPIAPQLPKLDQLAWALARKRLGIPDPPDPPPGLTQDQVEAIRTYFPGWLLEKYP